MKAKMKQKWIDALRSGKYKQGDGYLCNTDENGVDKHCCLGVLAEVAGVKREILYGKETLTEIGRSRWLGTWAKSGEPEYETHKPSTHTTLQRKLAAKNDSKWSFKRIATWIQKNVPAQE
jgi:hypothetical protein